MSPKAKFSKTLQKERRKSHKQVSIDINRDEGKRSSIIETTKSLKNEKSSDKPAVVSVQQSSKQMISSHPTNFQKAIKESRFKTGSSSSLSDDYEEEHEEESTDSSNISDIMAFQRLVRPIQNLTVDIDTDGSISSQAEPLYLTQPGLKIEQDFFKSLGHIPEVDEVSEDISVKDKSKEEVLSYASKDLGIFVNPLTGEASFSHASSVHSMQIVEPKQEQIEVRESESLLDEPLSYRTSSSGLSIVYPETEHAETLEQLKADKAAEKYDEDNTYLQFMELQEEAKKFKAFELQQIDVVASLNEQQRILNLKQTADFLSDLIDMCVQQAENMTEDILLKKNLDREKIILLLIPKLEEFYGQKRIMEFLNRKCAGYYRRKNCIRQLVKHRNIKREKASYYEILKRLDYWLNRVKETQAICTSKITEYRAQHEVANQNFQMAIKALEMRIKSMLQREKYGKLNIFINQQLKGISHLRQRISETRLKLLLEQHQFSVLSLVRLSLTNTICLLQHFFPSLTASGRIREFG